MRSYIIRRCIFAVVLVFISTIIAFTFLKLSPGKPGAADINPRVSQAYLDQQQRFYGLNRSPVTQYFSWLGVMRFIGKDTRGGLLQGDLGLSFKYQQPVAQVLRPRLLATLSLNIITMLFTWSVAVPLGIWAAVKQYKLPDKLLSLCSFTGMSLPGFFSALFLLWIFASHYHWLPAGGLVSLDHDTLGFFPRMLDYARHMILPIVVMTFGALASLQRYSRGNMLEVLREQYVTTARAKGLSESRVIYKHALRNAINPLVTMLGFEFAGLFGGAALLENVINYPGMGQLMLEALRAKDQCLVMTTFLLGSIMLNIGNLLAEILLAAVDPRVSYV